MGPDEFGEEFDSAEEEEKADPETVYAVLQDDEIEKRVTITGVAGGKLTFQVDGDDVQIAVTVPAPGDARHHERLRLTVARSALAEAFRSAGVVGSPSEA